MSIYHHGEFRVAGRTLPNTFTAYQAYGDPANACILVPTCYGARLELSCKLSSYLTFPCNDVVGLAEAHLVGDNMR